MPKYTAVCNSEIYLDEYNQPQCSDGWEQQIVAAPFDPTQIDPSVVAQLFGAGFVTFVVPFAAAWGARQLLSLIRR